jgi:polyphenol oxidase
MRKEGFLLRKNHGVSYYSCRTLEKLPWLRHGFSTRHGGTSFSSDISLNLGDVPWDSTARVENNRRRFLTALHFEDARLVTLRQIHSNRVHIINDITGQWNRPEGDALITRSENVALAVTVADCLPVLIADPLNKAVAAVHSGWRGTVSGILQRTILEMKNTYNSDPARLRVAVGPGIRSCCLEVGVEVALLFDREYPECRLMVPVKARPGKFLLDLFRAVDAQLDRVGVLRENRFELGVCTRCTTEAFFSHRAEGSAAGRMMALIGISTGIASAVRTGIMGFGVSKLN